MKNTRYLSALCLLLVLISIMFMDTRLSSKIKAFSTGAAKTLTRDVATLTLAPTTLPNPTVGTAYNQTITASGGTAPYTFSITSGALPAGLSLSADGILAGTPTTAGNFTFMITATDSATSSNMGSMSYSVVVSALMFSPTTLPNPTVGMAYSQTITASGGTAPYTFSVTSGALPNGLSLSAGGMLTGTPTMAGNFTFMITATDSAVSANMGSISYSVVVARAQTLTLSPSTLPNPMVGAAYSQTITASGGTAPYTFSVTTGTLPTGLSLATNGMLTGTPTTANRFIFTITAIDASQNNMGSISYNVRVAGPIMLALSPMTLPNPTVGVTYNQTITASGGTSPYTFSVTSGTLPNGLSLAPNGLLTGIPTMMGSFTFAITASDASQNMGSLSYTVTVAAQGSLTLMISPTTLPDGIVGINYTQMLMASGGQAPYTFALTMGTLPPGLSLAPNGNITGVPIAAGMYPITIGVMDSSQNKGSLTATITIAAGALTLTPATIPNPVVGIAYSQTIAATGGQAPYTFAVISGNLPPGLTLATNGLISGVASVSGSFNFLVFAADANNMTGSLNYTVTVAKNNPNLIISPPTLPNGIVGINYSQTITASGDLPPYLFTVTAGTLPPGLTLLSNGQLAGVPIAAGNFAFTLMAVSLRQSSGSQTYAINILNNSQAITTLPPQLPDGALGVTYNQVITAIGGQAPYTFVLTSGNLPPGLSLMAVGRLAGIPTLVGTYNFTISASDANGKNGSLSYTIRVVDTSGTVTLTPTTLPRGVINVPYSQTVTATGGQSPYNFTLTGGSLPAGLSFSPSGQLTGTPSATGIATFTITATDASNQQGRQTYTLITSSGNITLTPPTLPSSILGASYNQTITATGGQAPYNFTIMLGMLPPGLTLLSNGQLSGIPLIAGSFSFTIIAIDSNGDLATRDYLITSGMVVLSPTTLVNGTVGTAYSQTLTATGGQAPYTFMLAAGTLPPDLLLSATGQLMGIPTTPGQFSFGIVATDVNGFSGSQFYKITITQALSVELNSIYVADTGNNRIQKSVDGINWTIIGLGLGSGPGQFRKPEAVTASADGQTIYVADKGNNRIQKSTDGGTSWADLVSGNVVKKPQGVALALNGDVYVSNTANSQILRFINGDPAKMTVIATMGNASGQVLNPHGLAVDINNNLYIADKGNNRILKVINPNTTPTFTIVADSGTGLSPGQVRGPQGVNVDNLGNLYVADTQNRRVLLFPLGNPGTAISLTAMISGITPAQVSAVEGVTVSRLQSGPLAGISAVIISDRANNRMIGKTNTAFILLGGAGSGLGQFSLPGKIR